MSEKVEAQKRAELAIDSMAARFQEMANAAERTSKEIEKFVREWEGQQNKNPNSKGE